MSLDLRAPGAVLLVACYELGRPPLAIASSLGFLERAGFAPAALDSSVEGIDDEKLAAARVVAVSVPMHTALRLGVRIAERARAASPGAFVALFGHYAALNGDHLLEEGIADAVIAGEAEAPLLALVEALAAGRPGPISGVRRRGDPPAPPHLARLDFPVPARGALPPLERYARLAHEGDERLAGYVEGSRGCLHLCRHCPIPPVYGGRFFVVPEEVVLADIRAQVAAGARHITFGDPDFLNGPGHALALARGLAREFPGVTFDFTAKVEHLLARRALLPDFAALGCIFVVSAVESLSDLVLAILDKGHTRSDVFEAIRLTREAGIALRPSLVSFTPWTTMDDYLDVLDWIEREDLVEQIDPVHLAIRLLVPPGSLLLEREEMRPHLRGLDRAGFAWRWEHPDRRMDDLHVRVSAAIERAVEANEPPAEVVGAVREIALSVAGDAAARERGRAPPGRARGAPDRRRPPRLTESWFC